MSLAIMAKFYLKMFQLNTVNTFIYNDLNKIIFIRMFLGYVE